MSTERKKIRIALLFGGKSAEHDVSIMSARNVYEALDKKKYDVQLIGITKIGRWLPVAESVLLEQPNTMRELRDQVKEKSIVSLTPAAGSISISSPEKANNRNFDVVFPVLHGPYGEDGSVQGLLKLAGIPYVGAGVLGSAVGMDKDVMKRLLRDASLPIADFIALRKTDKLPSFGSLIKKFGKPLFIKPANLGSSVGVSRVETKAQFERAVAEAFAYDDKIVIEAAVQGREIECSVLGNDDPQASLPGEVVTDHAHHSFYSYEAKYLDEHGAALIIPAKLSKAQIKQVQAMAIKVFKTLCCEGLGRVDFFLTPKGQLIVNEINTIPGFTSISMYPKLWEASGLSYHELIDTLIDLALRRFEREKKLKTTTEK